MSLFLPWKFVCKRRIPREWKPELPFPRRLLCQTFNDFPPFYRASRRRSLALREKICPVTESKGGEFCSTKIAKILRDVWNRFELSAIDPLWKLFWTFFTFLRVTCSPDFYPQTHLTINRELTCSKQLSFQIFLLIITRGFSFLFFFFFIFLKFRDFSSKLATLLDTATTAIYSLYSY